MSREVEPIVDSILARKLGRGVTRAHDADDIRHDVVVRLLPPLQSISPSQKTAIDNFREYVAGVTYHAFHEYLRARYPERTRLKNHLKYVLTHSRLFALWAADPRTSACGFAKTELSDQIADAETAIDPRSLTREAFDANEPVRAISAVFESAGTPLELESFVNLMAKLWNVRDEINTEVRHSARQPLDPTAEERLDTKRFFERLWLEISNLRHRQRVALLLNLRDGSGQSALPLFMILGVASIRQIAAVLTLDVDELAAHWSDLPLDDQRIAAMLGITRQQVINLRKSARERLARRMKLKRNHS